MNSLCFRFTNCYSSRVKRARDLSNITSKRLHAVETRAPLNYKLVKSLAIHTTPYTHIYTYTHRLSHAHIRTPSHLLFFKEELVSFLILSNITLLFIRIQFIGFKTCLKCTHNLLFKISFTIS